MTDYSRIEILAKKLGFQSYKDYLLSDHWRNLKKSKRIRGSLCCVCKGNFMVLAHHIRYRDLLDVELSDLAPLCRNCHDAFHMACRSKNVSYIDMEIPTIIEVTQAFKLTEVYNKWLLKKEQRTIRHKKRQRSGPPNQNTTHSLKRTLKRRFNIFLQGSITEDKLRRLCDWMVEEIRLSSLQTPPIFTKTV